MSDKLENLSIDYVIFGFEKRQLKILLIKRDKEPELDRWSLPGGYVYVDENIEDSAKRILKELTGISNLYLSQAGVFGATNRYPAQRVISILYCALVQSGQFDLIAGAHAKAIEWYDSNNMLSLPFDHNEMITQSTKWLREEIWRKPLLANLLPEKFPLNQMQDLYQIILQESIDNRNFRKKLISQGLVKKLDEKTKGGKQRPAFLYQLNKPV